MRATFFESVSASMISGADIFSLLAAELAMKSVLVGVGGAVSDWDEDWDEGARVEDAVGVEAAGVEAAGVEPAGVEPAGVETAGEVFSLGESLRDHKFR